LEQELLRVKDPEHRRALYALPADEHSRAGDYAGQLDGLTRQAAEFLGDPVVLCAIASALAKLHKCEEAIEASRRAIEEAKRANEYVRYSLGEAIRTAISCRSTTLAEATLVQLIQEASVSRDVDIAIEPGFENQLTDLGIPAALISRYCEALERHRQ
jgi:hypothetical protein